MADLSLVAARVLEVVGFTGAVAGLGTWLGIKLAWKAGMVDDPKKHNHPKVIHAYPVPRGGGLALLAGVVGGVIVFLPLDGYMRSILGGAVVTVVIGLIDDKYNLSPGVRLVWNAIAALLVVGAGIRIGYITSPWGGVISFDQIKLLVPIWGKVHEIWLVADLITIVWIMWCINFVSISSGVDGQVSGVVVIASFVLGWLALDHSVEFVDWSVTTLALVTAGAYLGFLPWHLYPQKVMPGYSGAGLAGYMLAVLGLLSTAKVGTLIVVLGIPFIDVVYSVVRRVGRGRSPFAGDKGHLHHKLLEVGVSKRGVAYLYWAATAALGMVALSLNSTQKLYTMVGAATVVGGFLVWVNYFSKYLKQPDQGSG